MGLAQQLAAFAQQGRGEVAEVFARLVEVLDQFIALLIAHALEQIIEHVAVLIEQGGQAVRGHDDVGIEFRRLRKQASDHGQFEAIDR